MRPKKKKKVYSKINKHLQCWSSKCHLRKLLDTFQCVSHLQVFPRLSERRLREDDFLSMAALRSITFARVFLCSRGKLQELGVPMILVPGIQQGSLPGVLCVSWQETGWVWKPTWQVRLHWKIAWFLSKYCQNHPILKVCFLCVRSAFSGKKTQTTPPPPHPPRKTTKKKLENFQPAISPMAVCC